MMEKLLHVTLEYNVDQKDTRCSKISSVPVGLIRHGIQTFDKTGPTIFEHLALSFSLADLAG